MINSGELPPITPPKKGPSCWLIGGLGCLAIFVAISVVLAFVVVKSLGTPRGKTFVHEFGKVIKSASLIPDSSKRMVDIRGALVRYQLKKGVYPQALTDLVPDFLPDKSELHSPLDPVTDPTHQSFVYTRPAPNAPGSAKILVLTWSFNIDVGDKMTLTKEVLTETLDGHMEQTQYQDGKQIGQTAFEPDQSDN